jgi:hypothetical protein
VSRSRRRARGRWGPGAPEPFVGRLHIGSATSSWTHPGPCDASPRLQPLARGGPRVPGHPVHAAICPPWGPISPVQLLTAGPRTKRTGGRRGARCRSQPLIGPQIVLSTAPPARLSAIRSRRKRVVCAQGTLRRAQIALGALHPCSDRSDVDDTKTALTMSGDSKVVDDRGPMGRTLDFVNSRSSVQIRVSAPVALRESAPVATGADRFRPF